MKTFIILLLLLITTTDANQNQENDDNNIDCRWRYKCCKLFRGSCIKMCEPEIDCKIIEKQEEEVVETTTPKTSFGFAPVQALNVRCKFGYKIDTRQNCRRVMK